ncbi:MULTISPECIES: hypothetical protein [Buttiauxella]|nr:MULTISPECIES: hypothetical protein [Buttiauxella]
MLIHRFREDENISAWIGELGAIWLSKSTGIMNEGYIIQTGYFNN